MKAIRIQEFGGPEVLQLEEFPVAVPEADEVLVKVYASSVNPADYIIREGGNEVLCFFLKLPLGPGLEAAGIVEHNGAEVMHLKKGDKGYGVPNFPGEGSYAVYITAKASQFSAMPDKILKSNFEDCQFLYLERVVADGCLRVNDMGVVGEDFYRGESDKLFTGDEASYLNFHLNTNEFSNSKDLRNKYIHSSYGQHAKQQQVDYLYFLRTTILIKLLDDAVLKRRWCSE